jgi:hypothetical protein
MYPLRNIDAFLGSRMDDSSPGGLAEVAIHHISQLCAANGGLCCASSPTGSATASQTADQLLTLEAGEAVDPEQAVELIDFMLASDGAQAI